MLMHWWKKKKYELLSESFANNERISNFAAHFEDVIKNNIIN